MNAIQEEEQQKQGKKTYQELLNDAKSIMSKTAAVLIPELCQALKSEHPEYSNKEIQEQVFLDCEGIWIKTYIRQSMPSWVLNEKASIAQKKHWEKRHEQERQKASKIVTFLTEAKLPEPPEPKNANIIDDEEWERTAPSSKYLEIGEKGNTVMEQLQEIRGSAHRLFVGLTEKSHLPHPNEDLIMDYIKPTREFRRSLASEMEEQSRIRLYNDLGAVDAVVQDMLEILEQNKKKK